MGHGLHTLGVDRLERLDELQDPVELHEQAGCLGVIEFEPRKLGNAGDLGSVESQRKLRFCRGIALDYRV